VGEVGVLLLSVAVSGGCKVERRWVTYGSLDGCG
jgi:hypothetical protein